MILVKCTVAFTFFKKPWKPEIANLIKSKNDSSCAACFCSAQNQLFLLNYSSSPILSFFKVVRIWCFWCTVFARVQFQSHSWTRGSITRCHVSMKPITTPAHMEWGATPEHHEPGWVQLDQVNVAGAPLSARNSLADTRLYKHGCKVATSFKTDQADQKVF